MRHERTQLTLGSGEVYFESFPVGSTEGTGERYIGNTPSFQMTREVTRQDRATSTRGRIEQARGAVLSESIEVRMTTDNMSSENLDMWFSSRSVALSVGDEYLPFNETLSVTKGLYYQLGASDTPGGFQYIEGLTIYYGASLLAEGVHYSADLQAGRIRILPDAPNLPRQSSITATYTKPPAATSLVVPSAQEFNGALRYIAKDLTGPRVDYWFPQVRISPRGTVEMKGDDFRQLNFDITAVRISPRFSLVYALLDGGAPMAITADTTLVTADNAVYTADNHWS